LFAYLGELCVDKSVYEAGLSDPAVSDEDDVAVVAGLAQALADAAHHEVGKDLVFQCLSWQNTKEQEHDTSSIADSQLWTNQH
jgi:hypothetical protein